MLDTAITDIFFKSFHADSFPLVEGFYASHKHKTQCGRLDLVYGLCSQNTIIAAVRLLPSRHSPDNQSPKNYRLLRNLYVAKEYRGRGLARRLMSQMLQEFNGDIYLFSLAHLTSFYQSLGFSENTAIENLPDDMQQFRTTYQARGRDWVLMARLQNNIDLPNNQHHK